MLRYKHTYKFIKVHTYTLTNLIHTLTHMDRQTDTQSPKVQTNTYIGKKVTNTDREKEKEIYKHMYKKTH